LFFQPTLAKLPSRTSVRPIAAKHERVAPLGRLARSTTFVRRVQDIILTPFSNHCTGVFGVQIVRQTAFTTAFISILYPWSLSLFFFTFFYCYSLVVIKSFLQLIRIFTTRNHFFLGCSKLRRRRAMVVRSRQFR
jgi:hypothetical protein